MSTILLLLHVAAAVIFLGPVMVSSSLFGKYALKASQGDAKADSTTSLLHGITKVYGYLSVLVPAFGAVLLFTQWSAFKAEWNFHIAIVLAVIAWVLLLGVICSQQTKVMEALEVQGDPAAAAAMEARPVNFTKAKSQLAIFGGIFNLLWVVILVLMYL